MSEKLAITLNNLGKNFYVFPKKSSIIKTLFGTAKDHIDFETVHSLSNINLEIPRGEVHGIIGMNGAGKSTLLKILTGVLEPTSGFFTLNGKVAALLELGTGFHGELTGRQNVEINGAILGLTEKDLAIKIPEIQAFSELGDFFDRPVQIYSSGMYVRLAFSFAVAISPDILIIDEALSVGDAYFQQKCLRKIQEFKEKGVTILFVSHDISAVKMLCNKVSLLHQGQILFTGLPMQGIDLYNSIISDRQNSNLIKDRANDAHLISSDASYSSGNLDCEITRVALFNHKEAEAEAFISGEICELKISVKLNREFSQTPTCGFLIRDRLGYDVFGTNTFHLNVQQEIFDLKLNTLTYSFKFCLNLGPGDYTLTVAMHDNQTHLEQNFHWIDRALVFKVLPSGEFGFVGVARLNPICVIHI